MSWPLRRSRKPPRWPQRWQFHERKNCVSTTPTELATLPSGEDREAERARLVATLRPVWESRKLILRIVLAAALVNAGLVMLIPVRYEATTQLMPPDGQSGTGMAMLSALAGRSGGLGSVAGDLLGVRNSGALFVGILGSRTVQDRLIEQFELRRIYHASKMEDARQVLASQTRVVEDRKSGVITITVTDHDAHRAAAMAEAYVNALNHLVEQVSTSAARRERLFLEERLRAVKQDLDGAAREFSEFASKNTAIDIPAQGKAMVEAAATLQGQLIAAESELRGVEAMYTGQNVRVRTLRARVGELRSQLGKLGGDGTSFVGSKSDSSSYPAIRQLPLLGVTYADLYRRTKIQETVFELLTQQYELAKVQEAKEVPSVKVLDAAVVPTKKSFPPRTLFTAAGTAIAFLGACAWILAKQAWNGIDPQDLGKQFALEVAGSVRAEALRLAPAGALLRQAWTRIAGRGMPAAEISQPSAEKKQASPAELARTAGNSLG
jgi:uncharacterized protein involved in exopolysaccharide biosynthesis